MSANNSDFIDVRLPAGWVGGLSFAAVPRKQQERRTDPVLKVTSVSQTCFSSRKFEQQGLAKGQVGGAEIGDEIVTICGLAPLQLGRRIVSGKKGALGEAGGFNSCKRHPVRPAHKCGSVKKFDTVICESCDFWRLSAWGPHQGSDKKGPRSDEDFATALQLWIRAVKDRIPVVLRLRKAGRRDSGETVGRKSSKLEPKKSKKDPSQPRAASSKKKADERRIRSSNACAPKRDNSNGSRLATVRAAVFGGERLKGRSSKSRGPRDRIPVSVRKAYYAL